MLAYTDEISALEHISVLHPGKAAHLMILMQRIIHWYQFHYQDKLDHITQLKKSLNKKDENLGSLQAQVDTLRQKAAELSLANAKHIEDNQSSIETNRQRIQDLETQLLAKIEAKTRSYEAPDTEKNVQPSSSNSNVDREDSRGYRHQYDSGRRRDRRRDDVERRKDDEPDSEKHMEPRSSNDYVDREDSRGYRQEDDSGRRRDRRRDDEERRKDDYRRRDRRNSRRSEGRGDRRPARRDRDRYRDEGRGSRKREDGDRRRDRRRYDDDRRRDRRDYRRNDERVDRRSSSRERYYRSNEEEEEEEEEEEGRADGGNGDSQYEGQLPSSPKDQAQENLDLPAPDGGGDYGESSPRAGGDYGEPSPEAGGDYGEPPPEVSNELLRSRAENDELIEEDQQLDSELAKQAVYNSQQNSYIEGPHVSEPVLEQASYSMHQAPEQPYYPRQDNQWGEGAAEYEYQENYEYNNQEQQSSMHMATAPQEGHQGHNPVRENHAPYSYEAATPSVEYESAVRSSPAEGHVSPYEAVVPVVHDTSVRPMADSVPAEHHASFGSVANGAEHEVQPQPHYTQHQPQQENLQYQYQASGPGPVGGPAGPQDVASG